MMCENCGKRVATTFVQQTINGQTTTMHLCAECAKKKGIDNLWNGFGLDFGDFLGSLFETPALRAVEESARCDCCGKTFAEIARSGRVGCPECYTTFYEQLLPSIQRIHGKVKHTGKIAYTCDDEEKSEHQLEELKQQLNTAIADQEYEKCAKLRDKIKELESKMPPESEK